MQLFHNLTYEIYLLTHFLTYLLSIYFQTELLTYSIYKVTFFKVSAKQEGVTVN